ncbi:hypothetical protein IFM89_024131 [Coptis chinensis]|uniref:P-type ATPase A domain-containing protein n=1 Tax=Coptis chinensis TaxID=261450 RepID=A0A835LIB5_9MAGN|nr:hypothetical protein IFM89_024131 [Coptis chinensis]
MEVAAIMAIALANGGGKPPDWQDFVGIITLLVINSTISFIKENNAENVAAALMARLAPKVKVPRWKVEQRRCGEFLFPEMSSIIKLGDIVPADARLLEGDRLKIDGESLPVTKVRGDGVYSALHANKVLTAIGNFCICFIAVGMIIEIIVMYPIQDRKYRPRIDNLLVFAHWRNSHCNARPVLSITMAIGSHRLAQRGAIMKIMTTIEEMASMDMLCDR